MKLYLQDATLADLEQMRADFQAKVDFYATKYNGPTLAKFQDLLDQVKKEIESRF